MMRVLRGTTASDGVAVHCIPMNGHSLSVQEVAHFRTDHEAGLSEPVVTQRHRVVEHARERRYASSAKSQQRAASSRARA